MPARPPRRPGIGRAGRLDVQLGESVVLGVKVPAELRAALAALARRQVTVPACA